MPVSFSDLQLAFEFVSSGGMGENEAYLDRQSGKIYWGVVKLNNCRGRSGRDRRLDGPRIFAQPATVLSAKNVNLTKPRRGLSAGRRRAVGGDAGRC
jgi:hypothetical protein